MTDRFDAPAHLEVVEARPPDVASTAAGMVKDRLRDTWAVSALGWLDTAVAGAFATATRLRGRRVFHPRGKGFHAWAQLHPRAVGLLGRQERLEAEVHVSRGIGVPDRLPDFNGVAVRLLDAHGHGQHQDLLLVSALMPPIVRHVLIPVPFVGWTGHSSIVPYRTPDGLRLLGVSPFASPVSLGGLHQRLPFEMRVVGAEMLGRWEPEVDLLLDATLDEAYTEALEFDPWHTGDDLRPAGFLNRLRRPAYAASHAARRS